MQQHNVLYNLLAQSLFQYYMDLQHKESLTMLLTKDNNQVTFWIGMIQIFAS